LLYGHEVKIETEAKMEPWQELKWAWAHSKKNIQPRANKKNTRVILWNSIAEALAPAVLLIVIVLIATAMAVHT